MQSTNVDCIGLTWFPGTGSLVSRGFSLHIMLENLASVTMDVSMEWRPPFDEVGLLFLDLSGVGSHWIVFSAKTSYISTLHAHSFSKIPIDTWFLKEFRFDNLNHHREFGITATSLGRDGGIGYEDR